MTFQQIHIRVNDAATGQPTPVRLRITDAAGTYFAPYGRLTEFATGVNQDVGGNVLIGAKKWAYIDGTCEILLPPGSLHIEIAKGPEFKPIDEDIQLRLGKMSLRFTIERWSDVRKQGWYSGDTRVHYLSPDAALLEGQAEDVAVVNLLAKVTTIEDASGETQRAIPNILSFSGQAFARHAADCGVAVNTHNVHRELGSLGLLHCHRIVFPLSFDNADWALDDWCGQCHRKKGLVVWTDPKNGEPLADLILGNVDAFELTSFEDSQFDELLDYYILLDAGLIVPLIGASGKASNYQVLGAMRTYAHVPTDQEFTYSNWIEAVRAGRTFVTNGPLLQFTIDGDVPSNRRQVSSGTQTLRLRAEARSLVPFDQLEVLWSGRPIEAVQMSSNEGRHAIIEREFNVEESGWLAVYCKGKTLLPSWPAPQHVFAHTSPVFVQRADRPYQARPDAIQELRAKLDEMLAWAQRMQSKRLMHIFEAARTELAKRLS